MLRLFTVRMIAHMYGYFDGIETPYFQKTWYGRTFINIYYRLSPKLVKWFGHTDIFNRIWKRILDIIVAKLRLKGVKDTPYKDKKW